MLEMLGQHSDLLDKVLEQYITPDLFPPDEMVKEGAIEKATAAIKAHFMRLFIQDNNILPAVGVLYEMEEGKPVFSLLDHQAMAFESLGTVVQEYVHRLEETRKDWQTKFVNAGTADGMGGGTDDFSGGGGGDDSFGGGGDSFGGGSDDFGGGTDDLSMGDDQLGGGSGDAALDSLDSGEEPQLDDPSLTDSNDPTNPEPETPEGPDSFGAPEPEAEEPVDSNALLDEEDEDKLK
jgi:hypothetical protein